MNHADFATRCHAIELMVDSLGDHAYELAATNDWNETHAALVQTTDGLHVLDAIVKRTGAAHSVRAEEPNPVAVREGVAAAPVIPATSGANAPDMDRESTRRKERHDPLHALDVQTIEGKRA